MGKQAERVDSASRVILASPSILFRTFRDTETLKAWRVPDGVIGSFTALQPRTGGGYQLKLQYGDERIGLSAPGMDLIEGRFAKFQPDEHVVEQVRFIGRDGGTAGTMKFETLINPVSGGTQVTLRASALPDAIDAKDHEDALAASLRRLAMLTE
ncbi:SRPBCC domain-containing protein [Sphingobium sp.]|uniref:SRPBCC domain-containing protein n=1 Tax=Sphingobium sp. TaxID=1912891 RepID=UPI002B545B49|nr:SRPBCC domain-containing protein [Sphingobium sp.]HUD92516.1 SRPBCC domain-containing protein [Sphingobium sp.]